MSAAKTQETDPEQSQREYRLSALDNALRMRRDLKIYDSKSGAMRSLPFSAGMARKYAVIYLLTCYFAERGQKAWINKLLRIMGWEDGAAPAVRRRCQMALRRQILDLQRDFNFEVEAVNGTTLPDRDGVRYYRVTSFGLFNQDKLLAMLQANREIFIRLIEDELRE